MLKMDFNDDSILDAEDYKELVLGIILSEKEVSQPVFQLRFLLFIRAAHYYYSHNQSQCLEPFPSCFFDPVTKTRLYDVLRTHIHNIPALNTIQETTSLPELTWRLLHWIFTNPLDINALTHESEISGFLTDDLREKTKLNNIPYPSKKCILYEISPSVPKKAFIAGKKEFGTFYAFHGSPSQNFHSIIHRGLISSLNAASTYGRGTYLTSNFNTAKNYAMKHFYKRNFARTYQSTDQLNNLYATHVTDNSYCIGIVEIVNHPSIKKVDVGTGQRLSNQQQADASNGKKYYVVNSDEFLQLRNLIVFEASNYSF